MEFERFLIDGDPLSFGRNAETVVGVDDEVDGFKQFAELRRQRPARRLVRAVNLREQRGKNRRSRRDLDDLDRGMGGQLQAREPLADVERNRVARASALSLGLEVDRRSPICGSARR